MLGQPPRRRGFTLDPNHTADAAGQLDAGAETRLPLRAPQTDRDRPGPALRLARRPISLRAEPRRPRPGMSRLTASRRLVLPAPLGPASQTGRPSRITSAPA
jgi:hypothetical protein